MASIDRDKLGEYLSAYLDGELSDQERVALERLVARDPRVRTQLKELRETVELVRGLPQRAAPPSLLEDLTAAAEREQLLGDPSERALPRASWWRSARPLLSAAAAVLITVGGGWYVFDSISGTGEQRWPPPEGGVARSTTGPQVPQEGPAGVGLADADDSAARSAAVGATAAKAGTPGRGSAEAALDAGETADPSRRPGEEAGLPAGPALAEAETAPPSLTDLALSKLEPLGFSIARLATVSTLEQKNEANFRQSELLAHNFDTETNRLRVLVADDDDELMARSQLASFAVAFRYRDLELMPAQALLSNDERAYLKGRPGYNYAANDRIETLFRVPVSELHGLVNAVAEGDAGRRPIQLALGLTVAQGQDKIARLIDRAQHPPGEIYALAPEPDVVGLGDEADPSKARAGGDGRASLRRARGVVVPPPTVRRERGGRPKVDRKLDADAAAVLAATKDDVEAESGHEAREEKLGAVPDSPVAGDDVGEDLKAKKEGSVIGTPGSGEKKRAAAPADDEPRSKLVTVRPGELVSSTLAKLREKQRGGASDASPAPGLTGDRGLRGGQEQFVTVIIQFERRPAPPSARAVTQPADPATPHPADGG